MILRRPYAFLIKHFRLIHLVMFGMLLYVIIKARNILNFFKDYIVYNGNINIISSNFINYYIFVLFILVIGLSVFIYYLMRYKKKPRLFYVITVIVCVVSSVLFIYLYNNIKLLETISLSGRQIRLFRDLSNINFWILVVISIPVFVRGLGFDIKKFNFSSDLKELNLNEEDSAEVEVTGNIDSNSIKRMFRKYLRELNYYYKENTLIINIIIIVIAIIGFLAFPFNRYVVNRDLNEGEILGTYYFNLRVNKAYISERKRISKDNSYVILDVSLLGKTSDAIFELGKVILRGDNNNYVPSQKYYNYFKDIGHGYKETILNNDDYTNYILVFNIDNIDKDSDFKLEYLTSEKKIKLNLEKKD